MKEFIDFIVQFDIQNLVVIAIIFWTITRGWRNEVKEEIKSIRDEISSQSSRTDKLYEMFQEGLSLMRKEVNEQSRRSDRLYEMFQEGLVSMRKEVDEQSKRSDRLYEMFIDLLKEKKAGD